MRIACSGIRTASRPHTGYTQATHRLHTGRTHTDRTQNTHTQTHRTHAQNTSRALTKQFQSPSYARTRSNGIHLRHAPAALRVQATVSVAGCLSVFLLLKSMCFPLVSFAFFIFVFRTFLIQWFERCLPRFAYSCALFTQFSLFFAPGFSPELTFSSWAIFRFSFPLRLAYIQIPAKWFRKATISFRSICQSRPGAASQKYLCPEFALDLTRSWTAVQLRRRASAAPVSISGKRPP